MPWLNNNECDEQQPLQQYRGKRREKLDESIVKVYALSAIVMPHGIDLKLQS